MPWIIRFLHIPEKDTSLAILYGRLFIIGIVLECVTYLLNEFLRSDSMPKKATVIFMTMSLSFFVLISVFLGP